MAIKFIDFDWNEINLYDENFVLIAKEQNLVLRNLKNEEVLYIGAEAKKNLTLNINLLAVVPIENSKVNSVSDLEIILDFLIKKYELNDYLIVDRYNLEKLGFKNLISEKKYFNLQYQNGTYVDLRNNETIIYNVNTQDLVKLNKGKYKILNYLNRYFYLNFDATLNTSKSLKLLEELQKKKVDFVTCRSFSTREEVEIKVDQEKLLAEILVFKAEILKEIKNMSIVHYSENYQKVFNFVTT